MVFVLKSPHWERLGTVLGSQILSILACWLIKTFYWLELMSKWFSLLYTSQQGDFPISLSPEVGTVLQWRQCSRNMTEIRSMSISDYPPRLMFLSQYSPCYPAMTAMGKDCCFYHCLQKWITNTSRTTTSLYGTITSPAVLQRKLPLSNSPTADGLLAPLQWGKPAFPNGEWGLYWLVEEKVLEMVQVLGV